MSVLLPPASQFHACRHYNVLDGLLLAQLLPAGGGTGDEGRGHWASASLYSQRYDEDMAFSQRVCWRTGCVPWAGMAVTSPPSSVVGG